jgi:FixJ family two-component response regulator
MQPAGASRDDAALIAIVDDDASVRQSACRLIRSFGYRTAGFASGEEFLAADLSETACVLLDVRMPGMDGLQVQAELAARGARIPIVFLTARAGADDEQRARAAGAVDFLRKPAAGAVLHGALQRALQSRANDDAH